MTQNPFLGVWRRKFIQFGNEPVETDQQVLWIQGQTWFADVRRSLVAEVLTLAQYQQMDWRSRFDADLLGFAGEFTWQPEDEMQGICTWFHKLAITPRSRPDTSRYHWLSEDEFLEQGTCEDETDQIYTFTEHWQRIDRGPVQCWQLNQPNLQGQALVASSWAVIITCQRSSPATLPHVVDTFPAFWATAWHLRANRWCAQFRSTTVPKAQDPTTPQNLMGEYGDRQAQPDPDTVMKTWVKS